MSTNSSIVLKSDYRNDIRRLTISRSEPFDSLTNSVRSAYNLGSGRLIFTYSDADGDKITITGNEDLTLAVNDSRSSTLKIFVSFIPESSASAAHSTTTTPGITTPADSSSSSSSSSSSNSSSSSSSSSSATSGSSYTVPTGKAVAKAIEELLKDPVFGSDLTAALSACVDSIKLGDSSETVLGILTSIAPQLVSQPVFADVIDVLKKHSNRLDEILSLIRPFVAIAGESAIDNIKDSISVRVPFYLESLKSIDVEKYFDNYRTDIQRFMDSQLSGASNPLNLLQLFHGLSIGSSASPFGVFEAAISGFDEDENKDDMEDEATVGDAHPGVTCDGCGVSPIVGHRFKCVTCPNFDYCSKCDETKDHPATHAFLKIPPPKVVENDVSNSKHVNIICDNCGVTPIVGLRYKCSVCPDYDLCSNCEAKNVHDASHTLLRMPQAVGRWRRGGWRRHGGRGWFGNHGVGGGFSHHGFGPIGFSGAHSPHGFEGLHSGHHGHHGHNGHHSPHGFGFFGGRGGRGGFFDGGFGRRCRNTAESSDSEPMAKYVESVSYPDGTEVTAGSTIVKTWSIQNHGTITWPINTKLIFIRGDRNLSSEEEFPVTAAAAGQTVQVNAVLSVPTAPGRYQALFRLADQNRVPFGPRVHVEVVVPTAVSKTVGGISSSPASSPSASSAAVSSTAASTSTTSSTPSSSSNYQYAAQLGILNSMGFLDNEANVTALNQHNGNITQAVHSLFGPVFQGQSR